MPPPPSRPRRRPIATARWAGALLALASLAVPAAAREPSEAPAAAGPRTIRELGVLLDAQAVRLRRLVDLAERDPAWRVVAQYEAYGASDFERRDRDRIKARDVLEIMESSGSQFELRERAHKALLRPMALSEDPDLKEKGRPGRKRFAILHVTSLLMADDAHTRNFANRLLKGWFPGVGSSNPAISGYDARGNSKQWKEAREAWNKALR